MRCLVFVLVGCAHGSATEVDGNPGGGDAQVRIDSRTMTMTDAPGAQSQTLSQTTSQMLKAGASIACTNAGYTRATSYYRVFDPASYGINGAFKVTQVSFQIEKCQPTSGASCTTVAVRVGTYAGTPGTTLAPGSMTILASNPLVTVPNVFESTNPPVTPGGTVNAPISATIPAGEKLLVQVDAVDGASSYAFLMGANDGGETAFGYYLASACGVTTPTNISSVVSASPNVNLLLTVTGTL